MGQKRALWVLLVSIATFVNANKDNTIFVQMPNVQPKVHDTYVCTSLKIKKTDYIVSFTPKESKPETAHHMLLYGCKEPGFRNRAWDCGEMHAGDDKDLPRGSVCKTGSKIVYAWAMEAPNLILPKDVGFKIGGDSNIEWVVLQIHYKNVDRFLKGDRDNSGLELALSPQPTLKVGGMYLVSTSGAIGPKSTVFMEAACPFEDNVVIHPFAYRTHTHSHGVVNSGYRIRDGKWTEIGRKSPQQPQMFYTVKDKNIDVKKGDILAARCTMVNKENKVVRVGSTAADEMCNFYIMYWTNGRQLPKQDDCWQQGPPYWFWNNYPNQAAINLAGMPKTASTDPDSNTTYTQTPLLDQMLKTSSIPANERTDYDDDENDDNEKNSQYDSQFEYYNNQPEDWQELLDQVRASKYGNEYDSRDVDGFKRRDVEDSLY